LHKDDQIDTLVLGCTHYPVLKSFIESIVPSHVSVVGQGGIVADSLASYLNRHPEIESNCLKNGTVSYLTSENTEEFDRNASVFAKGEVKSSHVSLH